MHEYSSTCDFGIIGWTKEKSYEGGQSAVQKRKLNYRFHNPNTVKETADYILKVFMEANMGKVERAIREAAERQDFESAHREEAGTKGRTMILIQKETECAA